MNGPRLGEVLKCSAPGARQTLLAVVYGDKAHVGKALVDDNDLDTAIQGLLILAVVLVVTSTDCN